MVITRKNVMQTQPHGPPIRLCANTGKGLLHLFLCVGSLIIYIIPFIFKNIISIDRSMAPMIIPSNPFFCHLRKAIIPTMMAIKPRGGNIRPTVPTAPLILPNSGPYLLSGISVSIKSSSSTTLILNNLQAYMKA